jgi:hypothetical protein
LPWLVLALSLLALLRWRWGVLQLIGAAVVLGVTRQLLMSGIAAVG